MWQENKTWLHCINNIIAADIASAAFLASYLHRSRVTKNYASSLELLTSRKYKVIKKEGKVRIALRERLGIPFILLWAKTDGISCCKP